MMPGKLDLIREIDQLWNPVYPYLAQYIHSLYGRQEGNILEIGPFSGVIFELLKRGIGDTFSIASFPAGMGAFFHQEARERQAEDKIEIIETDPSLKGMTENRIDLAIFRGAFFFPSLFRVHFLEIQRVLRLNGIAFIGGGFGKLTPDTIIKEIGKKSRDLNLRIGKIEVNEDQLRQDLEKSGAKGRFEIISEGGLWILMGK